MLVRDLTRRSPSRCADRHIPFGRRRGDPDVQHLRMQQRERAAQWAAPAIHVSGRPSGLGPHHWQVRDLPRRSGCADRVTPSEAAPTDDDPHRPNRTHRTTRHRITSFHFIEHTCSLTVFERFAKALNSSQLRPTCIRRWRTPPPAFKGVRGLETNSSRQRRVCDATR